MQETWVWSLIQEDPTEQLSPCTQNLCSATREATVMRSQHTSLKGSPTHCNWKVKKWKCQSLSHVRLWGPKPPACQYRRHKRWGFNPWVWKIFWRRAWQPTPVFLPGESHEWRSLEGYSLWGHRRRTQLKWFSKHVHRIPNNLKKKKKNRQHWRLFNLRQGSLIFKVLLNQYLQILCDVFPHPFSLDCLQNYYCNLRCGPYKMDQMIR